MGDHELLHAQLLDRRRRLETAIGVEGEPQSLVRLLREVDAALDRLSTGTYGACEFCTGFVDSPDLLANPLMRYCLCELSHEQLDALSNDLELAWRIQAALLPAPGTIAPGWDIHYRYEPLGPVSGDYCDLQKRTESDGETFFVVGDVSGKGVAASLVMAHLNALFRSLVDSLPLPDLVGRANRLLLERTLSSHYATLVCGWTGPSGEVEFCNAGHCPPLVARAGGVETLESTGTPVGMLEEQSYRVSRIRLEPGETLLLYTDGLTEACDESGQPYGAERLAQVLYERRALRPSSLARACLADLHAFLDGVPRTDDLTLMVLRREDSARRPA
jgi:sigma-B regulation protein RsbU (phosphoserine phosphatase)